LNIENQLQVSATTKLNSSTKASHNKKATRMNGHFISITIIFLLAYGILLSDSFLSFSACGKEIDIPDFFIKN
jgi:hypothetical protein